MFATTFKLAAVAALAVQGVLAAPAPDISTSEADTAPVPDFVGPRPQPTGEVVPQAYLINGTEVTPLVGRQTGANGPGLRLVNCNPIMGLCSVFFSLHPSFLSISVLEVLSSLSLARHLSDDVL